MVDKKSNKISIKPMNNAAAIASTLGISANAGRRPIEPPLKQTEDEQPVNTEGVEKISQSAKKSKMVVSREGKNERQITINQPKSACYAA